MASASVLALCVGLGAGPAASQTMPTGGQVVAGSATITQPSAGQVTIRQTTDRGVINWQTFSVGAGGTVDFQQPSSSSATLNRVTGGFSSVIAGQISANGQVFLVNPNGIQITPTGTVRTGAFVASTLDIRNGDFLAGRTIFEGNGASASVTNQGTIQTPDGGSVVLVGGRVVNEGTIIANGGRVGLASGERVVVDLQGDGFLQVSVPTADADRAEALVKHAGRIQANGGRVQMRAATTADVARAAINVSGTIEARTVTRTDGGVVFGSDAPKPQPAQPTVQRGKVVIDGGPGGSVSVTGKIVATGGTQRGGDIAVSGRSVTASGTFDVAGGTSGGTITADGGTRLELSGILRANGDVAGGRIDLTADQLLLTSAHLSATGGDVGGLIRLGGAFQGGKVKDNAPEIDATFVARWGDLPALRNASTTTVDSGTHIDVSGGKTGGTLVVWSDVATVMAGSVNATGALSAGSVEISAGNDLLRVDLEKLALGAGGQVLLDPKNITIDSSGTDPVAGNTFASNPTLDRFISATALATTLSAGTSVTLQANNDISVNTGFTVNRPAGNGGNLTMQAGRSINFASGVSITTDNGALTLTANDTVARGVVAANRDAGPAVIDLRGSTITAGTGAVSVTMSTGAGLTDSTSGDLRFGTVASASSVTIAYNGPTASGLIELNGNIATSGNITLANRNLRIAGDSVLTSTAGTVTWSGEASKTIVGAVGGEQISFVQGTSVTRIGVMDTAAAARLSIGQTSATRVYGDANPAVDTPRLTSGTLRAGDTLATILAPGSTTTTWGAGSAPVVNTNVGSYAYTISAAGSIAIAAGKSGYFVRTTASNGTLSITRASLSVVADAKTKVYGDADPLLTYVATGFKAGETTAIMTGALVRAAGENVANRAISIGTVSAGGNYTIAFTGANLVITRAPLNVVADAKTKVYGDADPALTYVATGFKLADTTAIMTGSLTRTSGTNVGTYAITQGTVSGGGNYTIVYTGANLTITRAPLNVVANNGTKVYGAANPTLTYTATGFKLGQTSSVLTGALARAPGETVAGGPYAINQGTLAGANYAITFTGANFNITPATLNVVAGAKTKVYGNVDPALTYTASGFRLGDTVAIMTGALARTAGENVGTYGINVGTVSAGSNYAIAYTGANLTITRATLNVVADAKTKVYGDADPLLTYVATGFRNGDTTAVMTGGLTRAAGENVGTRAISVGTLSAGGNYTIAFTGANLTITRAPLNVVADAKTKEYGDADPALTYVATGFKLADTTAIMTGSLTRTSGTNVGTYAINQGTVSAGGNYTIVYTGANLTITRAPLNVVADAKTKVYGAANPTLTYTATGFKLGQTSSVLTGALARAPGETVAGGPYAINQGTLAGANYAITFTGANFNITPATLNVVAGAKTKVYGNVDPALTYTASGFRLGDTVSIMTGALDRAAGESVAGGPYAITQGTVAANSNYAIAYTGANLAIQPRPITVTADDKTKIAFAPDPALTWTVTAGNVIPGDTSTGALTRPPGETVGPYAITQGTLSYGSNYAMSFVDGVLTIQPRPTTPLPPATIPGQSTPGIPSLPGESGPSATQVALEDAQGGSCRLNRYGTLICNGGS